MSYLFGDATPSQLQSNFIEFLRDALDFGVKVLAADEHLRQGVARGAELSRGTDVEVTRLEALGATVADALAPTIAGGTDTPTGKCAEAIAQAVGGITRAEIERVRSSLASELARIDAQAHQERAGCVQALQELILKHDLPEMTTDIKLEQQDGTRYRARVHARTTYGLEADIEVEIPASHQLAHVLRLDKIVDRLEVQAPESGGWLRKEVKLRPQRLDKEYVTELFLSATEATLKLRTSADGTGAGFDVAVRGESPRVRMVRVGEGELPPFELAEGDAGKMLHLREQLAGFCTELFGHRKSLADARVDGNPLRSLESPKQLVERLIAAMAPTVQEISKRSLSPTELVLKRQLGDGRREEIFVSKDSLKEKLVPLPPNLRALFAPLGLADFTVAATSPPKAAPAPAAKPAPAALHTGTPGAAASASPPSPPRKTGAQPAARPPSVETTAAPNDAVEQPKRAREPSVEVMLEPDQEPSGKSTEVTNKP
jgi:hypothetical protein